MADDPVEPSVPPPPTVDDVEEQRKRVFDSLPPEIQSNPQVRRSFGLGDAVEIMAKPIARALGIRRCSGCEKRKETLNRVKLWGNGG